MIKEIEGTEDEGVNSARVIQKSFGQKEIIALDVEE